MNAGFEELEHSADVAIRVWAEDLAGLFIQAALALADQLADPATVGGQVEHRVNLMAGDVETLLVSWLSELLYLGEVDGALEIVFTSFDVEDVDREHIRATVRGGEASEYRRYIKAVTFSELEVRREAEGYQTVIVLDV